MACEACRYFDCGANCRCVCHSRFAEPLSDRLDREGVLENGKEKSLEGLSSLFQ